MTKLIIALVFLTLTGTTMADFIVGGTEVQGNDWETVVAIADSKGNIFCSGTAVDSKTIKTAAHCLVSNDVTKYVAQSIFPLIYAIDNPNKKREDFIKDGLNEKQADHIIKLQTFILLDPASLAADFGQEKDFFEKMKDTTYRFFFIENKLKDVFNFYAQKTMRVYIGNGVIGGNIGEAKSYKVASAKLNSRYLENNSSLLVAKALGMDPVEALKAKYGKYNPANEFDRLVLTLEEELPLTNYISEIKSEEFKDIDFESVTLVGFGRTIDARVQEEDANYGVKREVTVNLISYSKDFNTFVTHTPFKSACNGDSGGAAFVKLKTGETRYLGIISAGIGVKELKGDSIVIEASQTGSICGNPKIASLIVPAS